MKVLEPPTRRARDTVSPPHSIAASFWIYPLAVRREEGERASEVETSRC
jgi:hypothetical protein